MSNPLKKTMVYLGLADEEEVYDAPVAEAPVRRERTERDGLVAHQEFLVHEPLLRHAIG